METTSGSYNAENIKQFSFHPIPWLLLYFFFSSPSHFDKINIFKVWRHLFFVVLDVFVSKA